MQNFITRAVKDIGTTEMNVVEHQDHELFWEKSLPT